MSSISLAALAALASWFALDFIGVPGVVDQEPLLSLAGVMLALLGAFAVLGFLKVRYAAAAYTIALLIWGALQIETHWGTYLLFDASERKLAWYERVFGDNWRFLPVIEGRTTPDGYHTVLALLIALNLAIALRDTFRRA